MIFVKIHKYNYLYICISILFNLPTIFEFDNNVFLTTFEVKLPKVSLNWLSDMEVNSNKPRAIFPGFVLKSGW